MLSVWPPIVWIALSAVGLTFNLLNNKGVFYVLGTFIALGMSGGLLWWGNFFAPLVR